jgi:hypothetical protein
MLDQYQVGAGIEQSCTRRKSERIGRISFLAYFLAFGRGTRACGSEEPFYLSMEVHRGQLT